MMTKTGMIIVTKPSRLMKLVPRIRNEINKTLYIQYIPEKRLKLTTNVRQLHPPSLSRTFIQFYASTLTLSNVDVRVLFGSLRESEMMKIHTKSPVEVVYFDQFFNNEEMHKFVSTCVLNRSSNCEVVSLQEGHDSEEEQQSAGSKQEDKIYDHVVLGGTFDQLHVGHKILLTEAVLRSRAKVTVGVTDTPMLKSKKLWELIEPCPVRIDKVKDFLEDVDCSLHYDVVAIDDMYGPTKDDPTFDMLVVSSETLKGGSEVNKLRLQNSLKALDIHSVELLNDIREDEIEEEKISSSNYRLRLLGSLYRMPQPNSLIPNTPYVIGLTGGIASGKSSVSERLKNLGAGVINCDRVAHSLYAPGEPGFNVVLDLFGDRVLNDQGEVNRRVLGSIVFHDQDALERLNAALWPEILKKVKTISQEMYKEGSQVVIMEAAILVRAGWYEHCHEVWTCIIPRQEALRRLRERDGLPEEEAVARIDSQITNEKQLEYANVVLCTLWRPEYTQKQVEKAWSLMKERIGID